MARTHTVCAHHHMWCYRDVKMILMCNFQEESGATKTYIHFCAYHVCASIQDVCVLRPIMPFSVHEGNLPVPALFL